MLSLVLTCFVFCSLSPVLLKFAKKRQKTVVHREKLKKSPIIAPTTPAPPKPEEYSIPPKDGSFPLPSQGAPSQGESSQPDTSVADVGERVEPRPTTKPSFVLDESVPSFEENFKIKEEYFDDEGYMHQWAKKHFATAFSISSFAKRRTYYPE